MRIGFLGRGGLGLKILDGISNIKGVQIPVVMTCRPSPESPASRSWFQEKATGLSADYFETNTVNDPEWVTRLQSYNLDCVVAILWVTTVSQDAIKATKHGFLNIHSGALPKYRGNACFTWAMLNHEKEVGLTVHWMEGGKLDSGPILKQKLFPLANDTQMQTCMDLFFETEGPKLMIETIQDLLHGKTASISQVPTTASYCYPRLPRDGQIDWNQQASEIEILTRAAGAPYPGAYSWFLNPRGQKISKLVIHHAACIEHPIPEHYAVPGHLIYFPSNNTWGVECGDKKILILKQVEVDGVQGKPESFFKSVRIRLGLDVESILAEFSDRITRLESILLQPK
jgi:methionyl-tRNA formyltransferase